MERHEILGEAMKTFREQDKREAESMASRHEAEFNAAPTLEQKASLYEQQKQEVHEFLNARMTNVSDASNGVLGLVTFFGFAAVAASAIAQIHLAWERLPSAVGSPSVALGVAALVALLGWAFFEFKKHAKRAYATVEFGVAWLAAYKSTSDLSDMTHSLNHWTYILAIFGSIYIAVRAFSNYDDWREEQDEKQKAVKDGA